MSVIVSQSGSQLSLDCQRTQATASLSAKLIANSHIHRRRNHRCPHHRSVILSSVTSVGVYHIMGPLSAAAALYELRQGASALNGALSPTGSQAPAISTALVEAFTLFNGMRSRNHTSILLC